MPADTLIGRIQSVLPSGINNDQEIFDFTEIYRTLTRVSTPLLNMSMANNRTVRKHWRVEWIEADYSAFQQKVAVAYDASIIILTMPSNTEFRIGSVIQNMRTKEYMRVLTRHSSPANSYSVTRGFGGSTAAAGLTTDYIIGGYTAQPEGFTSADPTGLNSETVFNYRQIFDEFLSFSMTKINMDTPEFTKYENQLQLKLNQFMRNLELSCLGGPRSDGTDPVTGEPLRSSGGLLNRYSNVKNYGTPQVITIEDYTDWLVDYIFKKDTGIDEVLVWHGHSFKKYFSDWGADFLRLPVASKSIGTSIEEVSLPNGKSAKIAFHPLMTEGEYAGTAFSTGLEQMGVHIGQPMQVNEDVQDRKTNARESQILTEVSWEFRNEGLGGKLSGVLPPARP